MRDDSEVQRARSFQRQMQPPCLESFWSFAHRVMRILIPREIVLFQRTWQTIELRAAAMQDRESSRVHLGVERRNAGKRLSGFPIRVILSLFRGALVPLVRRATSEIRADPALRKNITFTWVMPADFRYHSAVSLVALFAVALSKEDHRRAASAVAVFAI